MDDNAGATGEFSIRLDNPMASDRELKRENERALASAPGINIDNKNGKFVRFDTGDIQTIKDDVKLEYPSNIFTGIAELSPSKLLFVPVVVGGVTYKAMIDSGATFNMIRHSVWQMCESTLDNELGRCITGLGNATIRTKGQSIINSTVLDLSDVLIKYQVVDDEKLNVDVVLGLSFLKLYQYIIDAKNRTITKIIDSRGKKIYRISDDGRIEGVTYRRVPVRAATNLTLNNRCMSLLSVNVAGLDMLGAGEDDDSIFLFEGEPASKFVSSSDGIVKFDSVAGAVVSVGGKITTREGYVKIKKGDRIGYITSLSQLEPLPESRESESWDGDRIRREIDLCHLSEIQREEVYQMLLSAQVSISKGEFDIGRAKVIPHTIELSDNTPVWQRPRKFSEPINKEIDRQCRELLTLDVIEYSDSPWSSPVVPVLKKASVDGGTPEIRMCIDYRQLNKKTRPSNFPMPDLTESLYSSHGSRYYTTLDLLKGYYQCPLEESSKKYTAFSTPHGHFQFRRLSFGLKNSSFAFQKNMQSILEDFCFRNVIVYIDDVLIMSKTFEEHVKLVGKVLHTLADHGIKIKTSKCNFFKENVKFLGHVIGINGIRKAPEYVKDILDYPRPTNVTELRRFLGVVNFVRKFIKDCSIISKPLTELTGGGKKQKLFWTEEMIDSFEKLKHAVKDDVILNYPDYSEGHAPLEVAVDASLYGAGGYISQLQGGETKIIAYASTTFSPAESRYSTIERELCAIRWGIKVFSPFILGTKFILYSDHRPLTYLHSLAITNSRLMRTLNDISDYDFEIRYRPGKENIIADAMSRLGKGSTNNELNVTHGLPEGLMVLRRIEGGGDSMFLALQACLEDLGVSAGTVVPEGDKELREKLVAEVLGNVVKYGIPDTKENKKAIKAMRIKGHLPREELLLAACHLYNIVIYVHHGMERPIVFKRSRDSVTHEVHLQCVSGVHYNPVISRKNGKFASKNDLDDKFINVCRNSYSSRMSNIARELSYDDAETVPDLEILCKHEIAMGGACFIEIGRCKLCALIDTGSQISIIKRSACILLESRGVEIDIDKESVKNCSVNAIDNSKTELYGAVSLSCKLSGVELKQVIFAVVEDDAMPHCLLLGMNFLEQNDVVVDFFNKALSFSDDSELELKHPILCNVGVGTFSGYSGTVELCAEAQSEDVVNEEFSCDSSDESQRVKFVLEGDGLAELQTSDFAIRHVRNVVEHRAAERNWKRPCVRQFARFNQQLSVEGGLLVRKVSNMKVPVVPFYTMLGLVVKVHFGLSHVGISKVLNVIRQHFWHPAMGKIIREVCVSCRHCQLYKVDSAAVAPPTLKVRAQYPFDLLAMDLLAFPRTSEGFVALLVAIDHFSKYLMAVPIKDKSAESVRDAFAHKMLPNMLRVPNKILTDNGLEFKNVTFNNLLKANNIKHIHSTSYRAASNGCVERANRTIIQLLREENTSVPWDKRISKVLMVYNATHHSQIGASPSQFLLNKAHVVRGAIPVDAKDVFWREGNQRFKSFSVGQWVAYKIQSIGHRLENKLSPKFVGPCKVQKVQSNKVTYEILLENGETKKAHHVQLRRWYRAPKYLRRYFELNEEPKEEIEPGELQYNFVPCIVDSGSSSGSSETGLSSNEISESESSDEMLDSSSDTVCRAVEDSGDVLSASSSDSGSYVVDVESVPVLKTRTFPNAVSVCENNIGNSSSSSGGLNVAEVSVEVHAPDISPQSASISDGGVSGLVESEIRGRVNECLNNDNSVKVDASDNSVESIRKIIDLDLDDGILLGSADNKESTAVENMTEELNMSREISSISGDLMSIYCDKSEKLGQYVEDSYESQLDLVNRASSQLRLLERSIRIEEDEFEGFTRDMEFKRNVRYRIEVLRCAIRVIGKHCEECKKGVSGFQDERRRLRVCVKEAEEAAHRDKLSHDYNTRFKELRKRTYKKFVCC